MIKIYMDNVGSKIENLSRELSFAISKELSFTTSGFGFSKHVELFNCYTNITYTGLIPRVVKFLYQHGIKYEIIDNRIEYEKNANFDLLENFQMRDYQKEIVDKASSREIIQAATGAGKTFIMYCLIKKFSVKPVVVIAPKVSLAEQIKEEFERFSGQEIGICTGIEKNIKDITICTPQSAGDELIESAKAVFYDECHNIPSDTVFNTANKAVNAYYRIGVSATPWRDGGDDLMIEAALSIRKPHLSINASKLISEGKLVPCNIFFIPFNKEFEWQKNYSKTYDVAIVHDEERNNSIANIAYKSTFVKGRKTLILIKKIEHGNIIKRKIEEKIDFIEKKIYVIDNKKIEVCSVEFLSGMDNAEKRKAVFQSVKDGFTKILIGSTIADEGLDLPCLDCLILAGSGKSSTRAFQRIGRVLRLHPNKKNAIVFDFIDQTKTFYNHAMYRKALYETEPLWNVNILQ